MGVDPTVNAEQRVEMIVLESHGWQVACHKCHPNILDRDGPWVHLCLPASPAVPLMIHSCLFWGLADRLLLGGFSCLQSVSLYFSFYPPPQWSLLRKQVHYHVTFIQKLPNWVPSVTVNAFLLLSAMPSPTLMFMETLLTNPGDGSKCLSVEELDQWINKMRDTHTHTHTHTHTRY